MAADTAARAALLRRAPRRSRARHIGVGARRRQNRGARRMNSQRVDAWRSARNVLCVRLDNLGDVLMTTPALRALKAAGEGRRITLLTSHSGGQAAPFIPGVDEVLTFDAPWVKHASTPPPAATLEMCELLRARKFDAAVIFTVYSQNPLPAAMVCYLAGI